jgi:FxsC-like protein
VSETGAGQSGSGQRGSYFYLSYAQSPPLEGSTEEDRDPWVPRFFEDLSKAVEQQASPRSRLRAGFSDREIPLGTDWKTSLVRALGAAEVFVPLYSPGYFARSWPGREWECFYRRLRNAGVEDPLQRFVPVLWIPLLGQDDPPGLQETTASLGSVREYVENGMRALLRLQFYRSSYQLIVKRLAARIVELADTAPVGPSAVPDIDEVRSPFSPEESSAAFGINVAAPASSGLPAGRDRAGYGDSGTEWRPYPGNQQLSLARYAKRIAEQMDFAGIVADVEKRGIQLTNRPGVLLIDPWFIADPPGLRVLRDIASELPSWILPVLVLGADQDQRSEELAEQVRGVLRSRRTPRSEVAIRASHGVRSLADFAALMPVLAAEAERQYLRRDFEPRSAAQADRPRRRLRDSPDGASPQDSAMETPDE